MLIRTVATAAVAARLPRLLLWRPQSSVSNIGRKPRHPEWLAAAGISRCSASAAALPSNSGGDTGSSGNLAADTQVRRVQCGFAVDGEINCCADTQQDKQLAFLR